MRRWQRSLLASAMILALSASTWATCVEGSMSPQMQQMACCKNGHHTCGPNGSSADCCRTDGSKQRDVVTIAKVDHLRIPAPIAMEWATPPYTAVLDSNHRLP